MAQSASKRQCYACREQRNESLSALLGGRQRGLVGTLTSTDRITEDRAFSDPEKVPNSRSPAFLFRRAWWMPQPLDLPPLLSSQQPIFLLRIGEQNAP